MFRTDRSLLSTRALAKILLPVLLAPVLVGEAASAGKGSAIVVVVHADSALDDVTRQDLARLFLVQARELDGQRAKPLNYADGALRMAFLGQLTGMTPAQIEEHFVQAELRGEGDWPPEFSSAAELVRLIVRSKTVLAWMPGEEFERLPEKQRALLKVLAIDGKRPSDEGYRFVF